MEVDPAQLRAIGGRVTDAAKILTDAYTTKTVALTPLDGQNAGWDTATAARSAVGVWGGFVDRLGGAVRTLGSDLVRAADEYVAADQRASDRLGGHRWRAE